MSIRLDDILSDIEVQVLIERADKSLAVLGYTEHGARHAALVSKIASGVLQQLGYSPRDAELAAIAGYMHDIGNGITRLDHGIAAALLARDILRRLGMAPTEFVEVMCAIGNHEEEYGQPVSALAAAVILADKSEVHRSRVRVYDPATADMHDRVNMATTRSRLVVDGEARTITLELDVDTAITQPMHYFEIFLDRMVMCRRAGEFLGCTFELVMNGNRLL